ncbi:MAG: hypothetical protein WCC17_03105 [Candidatus Nitrosopolaris sp.]
MTSHITMNCKIVAITGISVVLMSGLIFVIPLRNTDKVFAQTASIGNNGSAASKANTTTTATAVTSSLSPNLNTNFSRAVGTIASLQNNETGKPTWILSGIWRLIVPQSFQVTSSHPPSSAIFHAVFEMIKTDGKEIHAHSIYDFKLIHTSISNIATVFSGTATITMKDGPHTGVPIRISILNQGTMSIWIDPTKTNNHFGNTPIYGTISRIGVFVESPPIVLPAPY